MPIRDAPVANTMVGDGAAMNPVNAHQKAEDDAEVFPVADEHGNEAHYPGEAPVTSCEKVIKVTVTTIKYTYSVALLIFCITMVMTAIFEKKTILSEKSHPLIAFFLFWYLIFWLAMMEGGQACLVGLQPVDRELYEESHPVTAKCCRLSHRGDNMERFILGRQFLVCMIVFLITICANGIANTTVFGFSEVFWYIFFTLGAAPTVITVICGQLTGQVNSAHCMLDFVNNYFMLFTTYVALIVEKSGLLHSVYLVQILFSKLSGKPIESKEPPRTSFQKVMFWIRVLISLGVLGYSFAFTFSALFRGVTFIGRTIPAGVSTVILFFLICLVGMCEGMQIALFSVVNMPKETLANAPIARRTCELTFTGRNLQAFLIGRQMCVTTSMFLVAVITCPDVNVAAGEKTIFGIPASAQDFFNIGLLGAVITTIVASLAWRIVASSFPVAFLSNPLAYIVLRFCLILEATGICSAAWLLARIHKKIIGYQLDEVYIGTSEERIAAAKKKGGENDLELAVDEEA